MNIIIVGNGLAGSIACHALRAAGLKPFVIADNGEFAATSASSNLYCASWVSKWSRIGTAGIEMLEKLFPDYEQVPFAGLDVRRIANEHLIVEPDLWGTVACVRKDGKLQMDGGKKVPADVVIWCTGWRSEEVTSIKTGHGIFFHGEHDSHLSFWAPFKQVKIFQHSPGVVYFGDSTAILDKNYCQDHVDKSLERAAKYGLTDVKEIVVGKRPMIHGSPYGQLIRREHSIVMNGGGKNGMPAYAALSIRLCQMIERLK